MKFCFIDTETTGTDPEKHGLIQIAGMIVIDEKVVETFDIKAQPFPEDVIDSKALEVNGIYRESLAGYPAPNVSYRQFTALLGKHCDKYNKSDKFQFCAYNADFDADMIRAWFAKNNDVYFGSWFWWPVLDVAKLAAIRMMEIRHRMPNFKLLTVAKWLGIPVDPEKAHDAMYDIELTKCIFELLTKDLALNKLKLEA